MEMFLPAILSDLLGRSVSFVVQRYRQQSSVDDSVRQLQLSLLRVSVTVEEAEGRRITNQAMLRQLDLLREAMYRGYYMLDALTYGRSHGADAPPPCRLLSRINSAKRLCYLAGGNDGGVAELGRMVDRLGSMITDMKEFVVFLSGYPRVCHQQPRSAHLLLEKFMFGRQREIEQVVSFLLRPEGSGSGGVGVLPVVGPARIGKSTLVEHVCHDERVRSHFSSILRMNGDDLEVDEKLNDPGDHGLIIKHPGEHNTSRKKSSLVILELAEDEVPDEGRWRRLCSSAFCNGIGSKIIVTSRSEAAERLGTEHALRLKCLNQEAYWHYFKTLAFGSTNPEEHPKLVSIAMDICAEEKGSFIGANIACSLLKANLDARFWLSILQNMREYTEKHRHLFGKHPHDLLQKNRHVYLWRLAQTSKVFVSYGCYQACPAQKDVPRITLQEVLSGRPAPRGRFEALAWRSHIPPCYSYLMSCSVQTPVPHVHVLARKNRSRLA
ncbi:putative disease resistance RPP13-like protein 1 [Lolium rigidum]|uniref:putative disease resistance RPP13-like protein 1 n=1 Tax=Lolium rigidum TaxID=89674 RepID=UPI001F5DAFAB|nr:putative disease resistance RPP13-like protein 1 [Lolium rigidum]